MCVIKVSICEETVGSQHVFFDSSFSCYVWTPELLVVKGPFFVFHATSLYVFKIVSHKLFP